MPQQFNIHDVISDLSGTTMTLQNVLDDYGKQEDDLTNEDRQTIDAHIFNCGCCNWWCEVSEQNEDPDTFEPLCDDCFAVDDE